MKKEKEKIGILEKKLVYFPKDVKLATQFLKERITTSKKFYTTQEIILFDMINEAFKGVLNDR
ncbi:MAG: hypothetical protein ACE5WD_11680 [Candidatus Aminicenantia bacterium]